MRDDQNLYRTLLQKVPSKLSTTVGYNITRRYYHTDLDLNRQKKKKDYATTSNVVMITKPTTYHKNRNLIRTKIPLQVQITNELIVIPSITLSHNNPAFIPLGNRKRTFELTKPITLSEIYNSLPLWLHQVRFWSDELTANHCNHRYPLRDSLPCYLLEPSPCSPKPQTQTLTHLQQKQNTKKEL